MEPKKAAAKNLEVSPEEVKDGLTVQLEEEGCWPDKIQRMTKDLTIQQSQVEKLPSCELDCFLPFIDELAKQGESMY